MKKKLLISSTHFVRVLNRQQYIYRMKQQSSIHQQQPDSSFLIRGPAGSFECPGVLSEPVLLISNGENGNFNQRRMKQLVQEIRFKEKMQVINKKKGKYKRSTNNCHKKYIGILKNLLFLKLNQSIKERIVGDYNQYRNSRVYYFIILSYLEWYLEPHDIRWIFQHFCQQVEAKIGRYRLEINTTTNHNFIHFRKDQIIEMEYSIQAINFFLRGEVTQSIRVLYQKNKYIIIKRNEYLRTLEIINTLQIELQQLNSTKNKMDKLNRLNLEQVHHWNRQIDFQELENLEKASKKRSGEQMNPNESSSGSESDQESQDKMNNHHADDYQRIRRPQQTLIKIQPHSGDLQMEGQNKYPLLQLENSYQVMTEIAWYSWMIQKQKILQFQIKVREQNVKMAQSLMNQRVQGKSIKVIQVPQNTLDC